MSGESTTQVTILQDQFDPTKGYVRISQSAVGASEWAAVDLSGLGQPLGNTWAHALSALANLKEDPGNSLARSLGQLLFKTIFPETLRRKLDEIGATGLDSTRKRLIVDVGEASSPLNEVPWQLLHDDTDFLSRQGWSIVRVELKQVPGRGHFGPISRIVIVCALEGKLNVGFDADAHISEITCLLESKGIECSVCVRPDRKELSNTLQSYPCDALYFLGYGVPGKLVLERDGGSQDYLDAGDLVSMMSPVGLVYLNACLGGVVEHAGFAFTDVAQRLLLSKKVGSVVAMHCEVDSGEALALAREFLDQVTDLGDPEAALMACRPLHADMWFRSIPGIHTHVAGLEYFRQNRLSRILGVEVDGAVSISLPSFQMGCKEQALTVLEDVGAIEALKEAGAYYYPGDTVTTTGMMGTKILIDLLQELTPTERIEIKPDVDGDPSSPAVFYFGSISNKHASSLLEQYSARFRLRFEQEQWAITDLLRDREYCIPNPTLSGGPAYERQVDWGILEKTVANGVTRYFLSGLGDRATRGCAYFLITHWEDLLRRFHGKPFSLILRLPPGLEHTHVEEFQD